MARDVAEATVTLKEKARGAFWGAAIGDALGWPQEMPRRRVRQQRSNDVVATGSFETWYRRSGGRFMPHEETIHAGEYSDDTQLLLCSARSILHGQDWLKHLACAELPTWTLYQRGGGGATKRAVEIWVNGRSPWSPELEGEKRRQYFDAGGNGVAMRILPHSLWGAHDKDFRLPARAIFLNGICTHGHPRALVGALAYGYVAWQAFRQSGTLPYGHLLEVALADNGAWTSLPDFTHSLAGWRDAVDESHEGRFEELWHRTTNEMRELLQKALSGIRAGALSMDTQVLSELGCFESARSGAGTVCAAASLYLASKYAPDPQHGVLEAAVAEGADTDTLASMAGALLGIVSGAEWLQSYRDRLQDQAYLGKLAELVCDASDHATWGEELSKPESRPKIAIDQFMDKLLVSKKAAQLSLPDGRGAVLENVEPVSTKSITLSGRIWTLRTADGQTLHVKKFERISTGGVKQGDLAFGQKRASARSRARFSSKVQAVKLIVGSLESARRFYGDVLGLKVARESKNLVNFGGVISLVPLDYASELGLPEGGTRSTKSIICLETSNIEVCYQRVADCPGANSTAITERAGRRVFRCLDPDQNVLEIFEAVRDKPLSKSGQD